MHRLDDSQYCPFYCEENIFRLCERRAAEGTGTCDDFVVFETGGPVWRQVLGDPVLWDYHVFLVAGAHCFDFDTELGFPCLLREYLRESLRPSEFDGTQTFRVVAAAEFLRHFSSDRSHMLDRHSHSYIAPPPSWPCIRGDERHPSNLLEYVDPAAEHELRYLPPPAPRGVLSPLGEGSSGDKPSSSGLSPGARRPSPTHWRRADLPHSVTAVESVERRAMLKCPNTYRVNLTLCWSQQA